MFDDISDDNRFANFGLVAEPTEDDINHILIIDDSNQICSLLLTGVMQACYEASINCRVFQSSQFGIIETVPMSFSQSVLDERMIMVYTASSPRHALATIRQHQLKRLTIICDIVMPNDAEVGLVGMLTEIASLQLSVNLLFASGEGQNRVFVEQLINRRKAYFIEKGSRAWNELPGALVTRTNLFTYQTITYGDYDRGRARQENYIPKPNSELRTQETQYLNPNYAETSLRVANSQVRITSAESLLAYTPESILPPTPVMAKAGTGAIKAQTGDFVARIESPQVQTGSLANSRIPTARGITTSNLPGAPLPRQYRTATGNLPPQAARIKSLPVTGGLIDPADKAISSNQNLKFDDSSTRERISTGAFGINQSRPEVDLKTSTGLLNLLAFWRKRPATPQTDHRL